MAMPTQNTHFRSHHMRGWPVLPLKLKSTSLPTKITTQPKNVDNKRSSTFPIPSSTHKDARASTLSASSLATRLSLAYGLGLDHTDSPVSPLDIDGTAAHNIATYVMHASAEDLLHLSDPEADDDSDSGSESSFCPADSSGCSTPSGGADNDEDGDGDAPLALLRPLLLLQMDGGRAEAGAGAPETRRPHAPSLSEVFLRSVPDPLKGVLGGVAAVHDPYVHAFDVVLGKQGDAEGRPKVRVDPYEHAWYAEDRISSLSVSVMAEGGEVVGRFLLWVMEWARKYASTLEEVRITVPDSFPLHEDSISGPCSVLPHNDLSDESSVGVLANLNTLTWTGDTRVLPTVLARFAPHSLHILRIGCAALSIDDALLLISRLAQYQIYDLDLGTLRTCAASHGGLGTDDLKLPLRLPHLDTLKIASSIPLQRFFAALALPPSLCKLVFDLTSSEERVREVVASVVASEGLLGEGVLFMDIEVEGAFEGMEEAMRRIKEKAAFAYVAFRGQVAEEEGEGEDRV